MQGSSNAAFPFNMDGKQLSLYVHSILHTCTAIWYRHWLTQVLHYKLLYRCIQTSLRFSSPELTNDSEGGSSSPASTPGSQAQQCSPGRVTHRTRLDPSSVVTRKVGRRKELQITEFWELCKLKLLRMRSITAAWVLCMYVHILVLMLWKLQYAV